MASDLLQWTARWHDFIEVVGALATAAAVVVALGFGLHEARSRQAADRRAHDAEVELDKIRAEQLREAQQLRERDRRAQAERIIAWFEERHTTFKGGVAARSSSRPSPTSMSATTRTRRSST
ncbi:hypothetical protein H1Q78_00130 [Cellulosimicrobium cellulans]|uniref:hypothetical protein n=1 Tax=Cellulosimicrobium cellulans TaxID=1710 RepID=UPI001EDC3319|nr:hypothetical protein [Cellulosimicrobium cellulans]UKJ63948.1 hypothetical protein H1Q78_00130 [Cellulosimicrobium cellulans]